jgi:predicted amidohydrolase
MISLYTPSPFDVWDRYLDAYGADAIFPVARTDIGVIGTIASEEILYPEIARACAFKGAEILLHPTSEVGAPGLTPKHIGKMARASENMSYLVSANSAGIFGTPVAAHSTDGMSAVIGWKGEVMAEAGPGETIVANTTLDIEGLRAARKRGGMTNFLSRLPIAAFRQAYANAANHAEPNGLPDGKMIERDAVMARQRAAIEALAKAGIVS